MLLTAGTLCVPLGTDYKSSPRSEVTSHGVGIVIAGLSM